MTLAFDADLSLKRNFGLNQMPDERAFSSDGYPAERSSYPLVYLYSHRRVSIDMSM